MVKRIVLLLVIALCVVGCSSAGIDNPGDGSAAGGDSNANGGGSGSDGAAEGSIPPPSAPTASDPAAAAANADLVGIIGDSLTEGMTDLGLLHPELVQAGWSDDAIKIDGLSGRPITGTGPSSTSGVIEQWRADGFDPRVWLIALGTNNSSDSVQGWIDDITAVLNQISSGPAGNYTIYWMTTGFEDAGYYREDEFEQVVRDIAAVYPNVKVADYGDFIDQYRDDPEWASYWSDPVHNSDSGYEKLRLAFYLQTLQPEAPV